MWATKVCEISTLLLTVCTDDKIKVEISQNFVAFSEYMNFTNLWRSKSACCHCNTRNIWSQDLNTYKDFASRLSPFKSLDWDFWRVWTFNLCWRNWVSKTFSGSKRSTQDQCWVFFAQKKGLRVRIRNRYFDMNSDYKGNWFCVGSYPVWVGCFS